MRKQKYIIFVSLLALVFALQGCTSKSKTAVVLPILDETVSAESHVSSEQETEIPTWNGEFSIELPEGYTVSQDEQGNRIYSERNRIVGGMKIYTAPEGYEVSDYFKGDFLRDLGIAEAADNSLGYSGGGSPSGMGPWGWEEEYFSDVPDWEERTVHTYHQFFIMKDEVTILDFWFDLMYVDYSMKNQIISSIEIPEIERYRQETEIEEQTVSQEALYEVLDLSKGYTCDVLGDRCILFLDTQNVVAGMDVIKIPDGAYDPNDSHWIWLEKARLSDFKSEAVQFLGGMTGNDNTWIAEFASEEPEDHPGHIHRRHVYRVIGNDLYDVWFELNLISTDDADMLLNAIQFK